MGSMVCKLLCAAVKRITSWLTLKRDSIFDARLERNTATGIKQRRPLPKLESGKHVARAWFFFETHEAAPGRWLASPLPPLANQSCGSNKQSRRRAQKVDPRSKGGGDQWRRR